MSKAPETKHPLPGDPPAIKPDIGPGSEPAGGHASQEARALAQDIKALMTPYSQEDRLTALELALDEAEANPAPPPKPAPAAQG